MVYKHQKVISCEYVTMQPANSSCIENIVCAVIVQGIAISISIP